MIVKKLVKEMFSENTFRKKLICQVLILLIGQE